MSIGSIKTRATNERVGYVGNKSTISQIDAAESRILDTIGQGRDCSASSPRPPPLHLTFRSSSSGLFVGATVPRCLSVRSFVIPQETNEDKAKRTSTTRGGRKTARPLSAVTRRDINNPAGWCFVSPRNAGNTFEVRQHSGKLRYRRDDLLFFRAR